MSNHFTPRYSTALSFIGPFICYVGMMAIEKQLDIPTSLGYPLRILLTLLALLLLSRRVIPLRASAPIASILVGAFVFALWVGPDLIFGPGYRHSWVFENGLLGRAASSAPEALKHDRHFIMLRFLGASALVPVVEELFWRGWLLRWLVEREFWKVPMGAVTPFAFWTVAILFGSEHGPYWEVGLLAGVAYNWWFIRTRNLADCILAHAITNIVLSAYVLTSGNWQYWM